MTKTPTTIALIVAAGRGVRAGAGTPKQYKALAGAPLLVRTLTPFVHHEKIDRILVVIHSQDGAHYELCRGAFDTAAFLSPVMGGASRQESVYRGLDALKSLSPQRVLIHDGARPFVDAGLIDRVCSALHDHKAVLPVCDLSDTIARVDAQGHMSETLPRAACRASQTPQGFHFAAILEAHRAARAAPVDTFTDDAQIAHWAGIKVSCVVGSDRNVKITTAQDIEQARHNLLASDGFSMNLSVRTGIGYDVHAFGADGDLILGGVRIPHTHALAGHSDADVVLHALTDAILGAMADGDIGQHFPPTDAAWKGASSDQFLRFATARLSARGGLLLHLDVNVICQAPKIAPYALAMRRRIAQIASLQADRVSVKATTSEGLGFTGRREGIAAQAIATLFLPDTL